jgi:hypothetical protein
VVDAGRVQVGSAVRAAVVFVGAVVAGGVAGYALVELAEWAACAGPTRSSPTSPPPSGSWELVCSPEASPFPGEPDEYPTTA